MDSAYKINRYRLQLLSVVDVTSTESTYHVTKLAVSFSDGCTCTCVTDGCSGISSDDCSRSS